MISKTFLSLKKGCHTEVLEVRCVDAYTAYSLPVISLQLAVIKVILKSYESRFR